MTDTSTESDDEKVVQPFAAWLQQHKRGRLHDELSNELHELIDTVQKTGKPGTLTLQLKVQPAKGTRGDMLTLSDAVQVKKPAAERDIAYYFVAPDGNLSKDDVNQPTLPGIQVIHPTRKEANK